MPPSADRCQTHSVAAELPILVLVGGPGGAGKTTLARALADRLGLVHLSRDSVKSAIAATDAVIPPDGVPRFDERKARMGGEYGQRAFTATSAVVAALLDGGVSAVVDQAWRTGRSEGELEPLITRSRAVLLIASVEPPIAAARVSARGHRPGLAGLDEVQSRAGAEWDVFVSFDVGIPRLVVDTTDGYDPALGDVERWVWRHVSSTTRPGGGRGVQ